jgi:DNA-binding NtrC family response regulator
VSKKQNAILVVDDDNTIRKSLAAILEQEGYLVDTAENGAQALKKSRQRLFDLALVDMRLPDMYGTELLNSFPETTPKMAKIMVTGFPSLQNAIESVNQGADGYILKPVKAEDLLKAVEKQLQKRAEEAKYSEKKVAEYLETRAKELTRAKSEKGSKT